MSETNNTKKGIARFIGKIKELSNDFGKYYMILLDNISPTKDDGTVNTYYKGNLIWFDQETGERYLVKRLALKKPSEASAKHGAINSIMIDLSSEYFVEKLD